MRKSVLISSTLIAWVMAIVYDKIEKTTGTELDALLWAALITIAVGLYVGLYRNNEDRPKREL